MLIVAVLHQNNQSNGPIAPKWLDDFFLQIATNFTDSTKFANFNELKKTKVRNSRTVLTG